MTARGKFYVIYILPQQQKKIKKKKKRLLCEVVLTPNQQANAGHWARGRPRELPPPASSSTWMSQLPALLPIKRKTSSGVGSPRPVTGSRAPHTATCQSRADGTCGGGPIRASWS